ncbi:MAG: methyltransferase domain-containing protein [Methanobrevibacter sp.]|jgi:SAM-dependent methyltransferase|nr:methyltransferase domain-containing protein [Candidatus Methanovirga basalitermitum]
MECKICGNTKNNKIVKAKEMMFGYGDSFNYLECGNCGVLQLMNIPEDLNKYYPDNYYSHLTSNSLISKIAYYFMYKIYDYIILNNSKILGKFLLKLTSNNIFFSLIKRGQLIKLNNINKSSYILDIGCGFGQFLMIFQKLGFFNLYGIDISVNENTNSITYFESSFESFNTSLNFDLIFLNDSLEHMDNQLNVMKKVKGLLRGGVKLY